MSLREAVTKHNLFTKTRLYSLYSDFRKLKEANPDGYEANMTAWKALIEQFFAQGLLQHTFVLDTAGLQEELTLAEYGKPLALDIVLEELVHTGALIPLKQYQESTDSIYAKRWVRPVLSWAVNKFIWDTSYKIGDKKNGLKADKLVAKKLLEKYEVELSRVLALEGQKGHTKHVFTIDQFKSTLAALMITIDGTPTHLSDLDCDILLTFLSRDLGKVKIKEDIVKFGEEDVTEEDIGICQIKATAETLELKIHELQEKIDTTDAKLKLSLKNKASKEVSLNLLRSKKVAEQSLNKQLGSLMQLESVLFKIDESSTSLQLIGALEKGTSLLEALHAQIGGVDRVEKIMDEVEEQKYTADKIAEEFSRLDTQVDNEEIEDEFDQLLQEEIQKKEESVNQVGETDKVAQRLSKLKIAPSEIPKNPTKESEPKPELA